MLQLLLYFFSTEVKVSGITFFGKYQKEGSDDQLTQYSVAILAHKI